MFSSPLTSLAFILAAIGASTAAPTTNGLNLARDVESTDDVCLTSKAAVRCLPSRGLRNLEAGTAVNTLAYEMVPLEGFNILAGTCIHYISGYTCAQVCNYNPHDRVVSQKEVFLALDGLRMDCGVDHFSGSHTAKDLTAYIYGIGGDRDTDAESVGEDAVTGEAGNVKRAAVTESKYENGVLSITVDETPKSSAEMEAIVNDALLVHKRSENSVDSLDKRDSDPCDQNFAAFDGKSIWGCNKRPLNKDGTCDFKYRNNNLDCASWCEVRRRYFYGLERAYKSEMIRTTPGAPRTSLSVGSSVSFGISFAIGAKLRDPLGVFKNGLRFSIDTTYTHSQSQSFEPDYKWLGKWCGYFTLIPKMVESCGSMTKWNSATIVGPNGSMAPVCATGKPGRTFENQCITYPYKKEGNRIEGATVIVKVNCGNPGLLAPMKEQDPYYRRPGVADTGPGMHRKAPGDKI
ncbi:hypothetical protein TWF281_007719 [Arthrobotrys megalospora]